MRHQGRLLRAHRRVLAQHPLQQLVHLAQVRVVLRERERRYKSVLESTYLAMGFAYVRAGTQTRRGVFGYPLERESVAVSLLPIPVIGFIARGDQRLSCSMRGSIEKPITGIGKRLSSIPRKNES